MEVECGVGLWGFKGPSSLLLHCAKCNNVTLCNVLVISKSLVMVFDLFFLVWVFCLMWLVGTCDGLWAWTNYYYKWVKFFFWKLGFNTLRSPFAIGTLVLFLFFVVHCNASSASSLVINVPQKFWYFYGTLIAKL
jgi:hypothetical protein